MQAQLGQISTQSSDGVQSHRAGIYKVLPFYLCFARHPKLPLDYKEFIPAQPEELTTPSTLLGADPGISQKSAELSRAIPAALDNIHRAQQKHKSDYSRKRRYVTPAGFKVGDLCMLKNAKKSKLDSKVDKSLYKVVGFTNDTHQTAIVSDNSVPPKRWTEHVKNIAMFHA